MRTPHIAITLRGGGVEKGIFVSDGKVSFNPRWGMTRHSTGLIASTSAPDGKLDKVHIAVASTGVVLVPCEENPQRELVLVQEYSTGSGAKRWPGFSVVVGPEVRELSGTSTSGGSGGESWILVSAPLGWAENIAHQFIDERDFSSQTISYRPELDLCESEELDENSDIVQNRVSFLIENGRIVL